MIKRVLVIATGGTLACTDTGAGLAPALSGEQLLEHVPGLANLANFDVRQVMNIDSTNMQPTDWLTIASAVQSAYDIYDGFLVLHGTDTLAYTAAGLSCLIEGSQKPIVLTGSQLPMANSATDARRNVHDAACVACDDAARGVLVVFAGRVIDGMRARKAHARSFDAFESVNAPDLASVADGEVVWADSRPDATASGATAAAATAAAIAPATATAATAFGAQRPAPVAPAVPATSAAPIFHNSINPRVQVLKLAPGADARVIEALYPICDALVVEAFGLGGVPEPNGVADALLKWANSGKRLVLTTQCPYENCDPSVYEVGRAFASHPNITIAGDLTTEAALAKTMCDLA